MEIVGRIDNGPARLTQSAVSNLTVLPRRADAGETGLEVVAEIGIDAMPPTIFITAYQRTR